MVVLALIITEFYVLIQTDRHGDSDVKATIIRNVYVNFVESQLPPSALDSKQNHTH